MDKDEVIKTLISFKNELNKNISIKKVILYGSYSRNQQRKDSDIDVAIVVEKIIGDYLSLITLIWKIGSNINSRIEPVVFIENQKDPSGFFESIMKYGIEI